MSIQHRRLIIETRTTIRWKAVLSKNTFAGFLQEKTVIVSSAALWVRSSILDCQELRQLLSGRMPLKAGT